MSKIYSRLMLLYRQFDRYYTHQFAPLLKESGLSLREIHVLLFLANNPGLDTARDVTVYRGITKSQVSAAVDLLTERGILQRKADPADRRVIHLSITQLGNPLVTRAQEIQEACWQRILEGLTPEEEEQLHTLVEKVFAVGEQLMEKEHLE